MERTWNIFSITKIKVRYQKTTPRHENVSLDFGPTSPNMGEKIKPDTYNSLDTKKSRM